MTKGITLKSVRKKVAVVAAAAGLIVAFSGQAQAAEYGNSTKGGCAFAGGDYSYWKSGDVGRYPLYETAWDMTIWDNCSDGKGAGLYTTYQKWEGGQWKYHDLTRLGADTDGNNNTPGYAKGRGHDVRDVQLYACLIGDASSCVTLL